ncbi:MAG: ABC transporter ATP-binding protein [Deltaproteobacteria bacterium]|nr:ABC transporter ATP-binding protein [Deltaproteobacteria bacterium]
MIQLKHLSKSFGSNKVLNDLNLEIPREKITVILGRSGCGKSVLLKHVIGLLRPDAGDVTVDGVSLNRLSDKELALFRRRFGMLFQSAALFDSLTVFENVAFPLREHSGLSPDKIETVVKKKLEAVGLSGIEDRRPSELSGGMRKRVGLARAIALEPKIILYDEPTTGLDPIMTSAINRLIVEMPGRLKITSVVISHDIESTFFIADKVALLHEGRIVAQGSPEEIKKSDLPVVRQFLEGKD